MPIRPHRTPLLVAVALGIAACSTGGGLTVERSDTRDRPLADGPISWEICGDDLDCGTLTVPRDHDDPSAGSFELALVRHPARSPDERIGSLLVNPGGPGFGGSFLAEQAEFIYSSTILDRFDIIGFDPRGTGDSSPPVDCVDEYDPWLGLDASPDTDAERAALRDAEVAFAAGCEERSADVLPHVSTKAAARDMDLIRQALGEDTISYFGFSYGSELGSVWIALFPDTVRAAVLDGASDPTANGVESALQQAVGFETQLDAFLADCSSDADCALRHDGDAGSAFDDLMAEIDAEPLVVEDDRTAVTQGVAFYAIANALYSSVLWLDLREALGDAQRGDGAGLLALYDDYLDRQPDGTYDNTLEAFNAISCLDDAGPESMDDLDGLTERFVDAAPRLGAYFATASTCVDWPAEAVGSVDVTGAGRGPVLVIGTTGDPATPLAGTRRMAETLADGRLIVVEADQHTGYGLNRCVIDAVDAYLVDLDAPADELLCD